MRRKRWTLSLELEYDHAIVMAGREYVQSRMASNDPIAIVLTAKRVQTRSLGHVPNSYAFVFGVAHNELLFGMEHDTRNVVVMAPACVHFPSFCFVHSPQFNLSIVSTTHNQGQSWMKSGPVDTAIMSFKHVFDHTVSLSE